MRMEKWETAVFQGMFLGVRIAQKKMIVSSLGNVATRPLTAPFIAAASRTWENNKRICEGIYADNVLVTELITAVKNILRANY